MEPGLSYNPTSILCPVDMSELSDLALKYAHVGARMFDASLTVLHAMHVDVPRYLSRELTAQVVKEIDHARAAGIHGLEAHVRRVLGDADSKKVRMRYRVTDSEPAEAVMQALAENQDDLVVMGTHGYSGLKHWMLGSVTESILHRSEAPVFIVRQKITDFIDTTQPEARPRIQHILCPCNLTTAAGHALRVAVALAGRFEARLTVLRSLESGTATDEKDFPAWIQKTVPEFNDIDLVVRRGTAAAQAIDLTKEIDCDLIVIGAHHKQFEQGTVMGRTTELVLRHAPVPVLAVPYRNEKR
ncbi:universal stress protein [uncultured Desulfosarcina sp.]|uniref:universal stress protein n=1 Tax=uncultured Desulfosarcina sp. TaxID=218289 RepID=UPI0029C90D38|nr:universal stress protein [uncultured Desulfosarcina sp.]